MNIRKILGITKFVHYNTIKTVRKRKKRGGECMIYEKYLLDVNDVGTLLHCSSSHAYRVIRDLNKELAKGGYLVVAGKIPKAYLEQKLFGLKESEKEN